MPDTVCSEEEFKLILIEQVEAIVHVSRLVRQHPRARLSRRVHAAIAEEASDLEDLLDDYDARYNRVYARLNELVAALRTFGAAGYTLKNIQVRSAKTEFLGSAAEDVEFRRETDATLNFIDRSIRLLLAAIDAELIAIFGRELEAAARSTLITQDGILQKRLPHTLVADESTDVGTRLATEATLFLAAAKLMSERALNERFGDVAEMERYVREVCDEEQCRFLETKLKNIQSRYDTFIKNTRTERDDPTVREFRYGVGMALQLTRVMTNLSHFYERHEDEGRSEAGGSGVAEVIDKGPVLDRLLNYAHFYCLQFMSAGQPLAESILDRYTTMETATLDIPDGTLLHLRPASLISRIVTHHGTPVEMSMGTGRCYAGSVTQVVILAGNQDRARQVTFSGDRRPIADLKLLFEHGVGEHGFDGFPPELAYLKS